MPGWHRVTLMSCSGTQGDSARLAQRRHAVARWGGGSARLARRDTARLWWHCGGGSTRHSCVGARSARRTEVTLQGQRVTLTGRCVAGWPCRAGTLHSGGRARLAHRA